MKPTFVLIRRCYNLYSVVDRWFLFVWANLLTILAVPQNNSFHCVNRSRRGLIKNSFMGCTVSTRRLMDRALPSPASPLMRDFWIGLIIVKNLFIRKYYGG